MRAKGTSWTGTSLICYDRKGYVPKNLRRRVLDWYHICQNHPGGNRLEKKFEKYDTGKALLRKNNCVLRRARHVNS